MRPIKTIALFLLATPILLLGLAYWSMNSLPVPQEKADAIVVGMTREQIKDMLGKPKRIDKNGHGENWLYSKPMQWSMFWVNFSNEGKVIETVLDY